MTPEEYRERFIARIKECVDDNPNAPWNVEILEDTAVTEHDCWVETYADGDFSDPEGDADEALTYWAY